ncbi:DUF3472 domain-containing protein [Aestuariibaculum marinum]|uniref:RICIN domain-containing protein n=1 Tax=Aestuariibaculum marinum TaxID=2683592 RepID=A0A8J6Q196_9FLAO|nr:RICIN domain-containing protein [Aestuariibaculum marinum]MBD0823179.1 RICIN domain-containing protein [Aestuariibaculum marinum]
MKKVLLNFWAFFICLISFGQDAAPSTHMGSNDNSSGDIIMKTVRSTITTNATYYCTMQWNAGGEGGAYCGFQDSPDKGHQFIYSIWDPSNDETITAAYRPDGTIVQNFGGEGTGLKSENQIIGWDLNEWNTVVTRRWDVGDHTFFGFWIRRDSQNKWYHMVTMDYPVANVTFNGSTNAFLEDWLSSGANTRRFEMKDAFKRKLDGTWLPMTQGNFSVNSGDINSGGRSENYATAYDADENNGVFAMQIGGNTSPSFAGTSKTLTTSTYASEPQNAAISFSITGAATNNVIWEVPTSSTPQFKFTVKINNITVGSEIEPEVRHFNLSASEGDSVEVILEDILGRTSTVSSTISAGTIDDPVAIDYTLANGTYKITGVESGKVIAPTTTNTKTNLATYNYSPYHQWSITSIGDGKYELINTGYNQPMDAFAGVNKVGIYGYHGQPNQQWYITHAGDGKYKLASVGQGGKVAKAAGITDGADVDLSNFSGHASELFTFDVIKPLDEGTYTITSVESDLAVSANGSNVELATPSTNKNQQWAITLKENTTNTFILTNVENGDALDRYGVNEDTSIGTYGTHGLEGQQWTISLVGENKYSIINSNANKGLKATGTISGSDITLNSYSGTTSQQFTFTLVDETLSTNTPLQTNAEYFKFYPNPASNTLNVLIDNKINKSEVLVEIYSLTGSLITKKHITVGLKDELNISNLSSGLYILRSEGVTQKIIIK